MHGLLLIRLLNYTDLTIEQEIKFTPLKKKNPYKLYKWVLQNYAKDG